MIRLTGPQNPAIIEREMAALLADPSDYLQIPVHPKEWWLGGEAGLVQLEITWARNQSNAVLVTHIKKEEDPTVQLAAMSRRLFGFVALLMANEILDLPDGIALRDGTATSPQRSLRPIAYAQCRHVVDMMFQPIARFALGSKVFLVCADHSSLSAIPWLYTPSKTVLDRLAFVDLAHELLTKTSGSPSYTNIDQRSISRLGAILHELFKNTDEWAKTNESGVPWRRSVRGVTAERHSWSGQECARLVHDNPSLGRYFDSFQEHTAQNRHLFLELGVFDSGLGLARQWLGSSWHPGVTLDAEHEACKDCLTKHQSSSKSRDRGLGLAEVMSALNSLHGFLRIRTGRLSLYRDFSSVPLRAAGDVSMYDFVTATNTLTALPPVYGTHYQMLIPILHETNG